LNARVTKGVDMLKNLSPAGERNQRMESGSGNITEERERGRERNGCNGERGISFKSRNGRTGLLFLCNMKV
jgi:hypothetical protein